MNRKQKQLNKDAKRLARREERSAVTVEAVAPAGGAVPTAGNKI